MAITESEPFVLSKYKGVPGVLSDSEAIGFLFEDAHKLQNGLVIGLGGSSAAMERHSVKCLNSKAVIYEADIEHSPFIKEKLTNAEYKTRIRSTFLKEGLPIPEVFTEDIANCVAVLRRETSNGIPSKPIVFVLDTCTTSTLVSFKKEIRKAYPSGLPCGFYIVTNTDPYRNPKIEFSLASGLFGQNFTVRKQVLFKSRVSGSTPYRLLSLFSSTLRPHRLKTFLHRDKNREVILIANSKSDAHQLLCGAPGPGWFYVTHF